jgi:hypothetical protein
MNLGRFPVLILLVVTLTGMVSAEYVGVAPGVKDIGTVERGQTYEIKFYLVTNVEDEFQVTPSYTRPNPSIYQADDNRRYDFEPENASQERIDDWVKFPRETFNVDPSTSKAVSLTGGGVANAKGTINMYIEIPEDAEPGYHAGAVNINPDLSTSADGGAAVSTMGLSQFIFTFRVPGVAKRSLEIREVNALRNSEGGARIDYLVKNDGTTTVRLNRGNTYLYNQFGNQTGTLTYGGQYIKPGDTKIIHNYWKDDNLESGEYRIRGEMNYLTGQSFIDDTIDISEYVQIESTGSGEGEDQTMPWWLVVMVLVLIGVLMYFMEIDPLWILLVTGLLTLSAFILASGLPIYLIPILIIVALAVVYVV